MNFELTIKILQIVLAVILTFFVLIQSKGGGLSSAASGIAGYYRTRRGIERLLFALTIILGLVFVTNSLLIVLFS